MNKKIKTAGIIFIIVAVIFSGLFAWFQISYSNMVKEVESFANAVMEVDLSKIEDGIYSGSFSSFLISVELNAEIQDHKIKTITVVKQSNGKGREGREVIDRIIQKQSLMVDAKTGATGSSKVIIIALDRALKKK